MTDIADSITMQNHEVAEQAATNSSHIELISFANETIALIPARYCLLTSVELQAKKQKDLLAALPYALEEQLSQAVEELHFVPVAIAETENQYAVVITSQDKMIQWSEVIGSHDTALYPDVLLLPIKDQSWTIVVSHQRVLLRMGHYEGFESSLSTLMQSLEVLIRDREMPANVELWLAEGALPPQLPDWMSALVTTNYYKGELYPWLAQSAQLDESFNLLTGVYARKRSEAPGLKSWLPSIVIFSLAFLAYIGLGWKQINEIESETQDYQEKTRQTFTTTFPEVKRIVNPRVQAEQQLQELAKALSIRDTDFFPLFDTVMNTVNQSRGLSVNGFSWKNSILQLKTSSTTVTQVEQLKSQLSELNLQVEIINAVNRDGAYQAQLKIQENVQ